MLDQPFAANGNLATAGDCVASKYLAAWFIAGLVDGDVARNALFITARRWR
ncbi:MULTISPECIES: hypothetical protein [unclassified Pseudomonas]|uniref:hypothetical protein n=1 Tax=unclassified Pseudomonas TaxID=196821 RepID=UPI0002EDCEC7|nr:MULTISPECIES: hypothetical protein [unclassified Pseudomonas]